MLDRYKRIWYNKDVNKNNFKNERKYHTMENKKMTYAQALVNAMNVVTDEETKNRLADLKASLEKKASSKKTVDNSGYYESVRNALAEKPLTPTELMGVINVANTQKVSAIVKGMTDVVKTTKGKKVFYSLA